MTHLSMISLSSNNGHHGHGGTLSATSINLIGPISGVVGVASSAFTVTANGTLASNVVVTPSDGGAGGTFSPTSLTLTSGSTSGTFSYTAANSGAKSISITNNTSLANGGSPISYSASSSAATAVVLSGPTSGTTGSASSNFTVAANGTLSGTVTVTPSDGGDGGTFAPTTITLNPSTASGTFAYTAATDGSHSVSVTNNGGLTNSGTPISYTSNAAAEVAIAVSVSSSAGAGTYPYLVAVYPLHGDVPLGQTLTTPDDSSLRASILSTYDDGSAAVMVLAGNVTLAANQTKALVLQPTTPPGGTALTTSRITTLVSSVAVNFTGSYGGTATLSSFGSPERIWWANPQTICARYRLAAPTPGSTKLEAVIDIHAYADSARAFVEVVIENGKVTIGSATAPADATYTNMAVAVNGSNIATVSSPTTTTVRGVNIYQTATHQEFRAWYASGWVGGDPGIEVVHDITYLQRHPLFPFIDQPTSANFLADQNGFGYIPATMTYTPWTIAEQRPSMAAPGDDVSIGLFPRWDMQYIQTGNKHAANAVRVNALAALSYPINYRDSTTGVLPTLDQTNAAGVFRSSGLPELPYGSSTTSSYPYWEEEHPPAVGLVAFLTRPSPVFIEIAQKAAFFAFTWGRADGTFNKWWAGRSKAWAMRAISHAAFLTPTSLPSGGTRAASEVTDWRSAARDCVGRNVARLYSSWISAPLYANPLKAMWGGTPGYPDESWEEEPGNSGFDMSMWMHWWFASTMHRLDKSGLMASHAQASNLVAFVDWALTGPAKIVNDSSGGEWRFQGKLTTIGTNGHPSSTTTDVGDPGVYANFATAYSARRGTAPTLVGTFNYAFGNVQTSYVGWDAEIGPRTMADSYAIIFIEALATAAERGVAGASTAWNTVIANITNWSTWRSGLRTDPRAAHYPRSISGSNYVNPKWPTWRRAMTPCTWAKIGSTMDETANSQNIAALNPTALYNASPRRSPWYQIPGAETALGTTGAVEGFTALVDDWCGAAFNEATQELVVFGGGHNGYAGNEVISANLLVDSPVWRLERPPTGWKGSASEGITLSDRHEDLKLYSNGDPRSAHSYDEMTWANGSLYVMPSATFQEPTGVESTLPYRIFKFTPGTNPTVGTDASYGTWSLVATMPSNIIGVNYNSGSLVHDSKRNYLYCATGATRALQRYDLTNNVWLTASPTLLTDSDLRGIYIPQLDLVIYMNWFPSGRFTIYDPSTNTMYTPGALGTAPAPTRSGTVGSSTLEYHSAANWVPSLGSIVSWAEGGTGFHVLTPPVSGDPTTTAWTWGRLEASAANTVTPDPRNPNGDYGRFFYSAELHCLGVVTSTKANWPPGAPSSGQLNIFALP